MAKVDSAEADMRCDVDPRFITPYPVGQILTSPAFGEKHPLYIAKWHGHTRRSFLSWFRREEGWSVRGHHQPAQPCKVAGNPLDAMAPSNPAAPVPLVMALPFQSMTAALTKNVFWPLSAKALIAFTAAGPPLSWRIPTLLHQSWPLLIQENELWQQRIMCRALEYSKSSQLWKAFKVHSWGS